MNEEVSSSRSGQQKCAPLFGRHGCRAETLLKFVIIDQSEAVLKHPAHLNLLNLAVRLACGKRPPLRHKRWCSMGDSTLSIFALKVSASQIEETLATDCAAAKDPDVVRELGEKSAMTRSRAVRSNP